MNKKNWYLEHNDKNINSNNDDSNITDIMTLIILMIRIAIIFI